MNDDWHLQLERDGYTLLRHVFPATTVQSVLDAWQTLVEQRPDDPGLIRNANGVVFAGRNLVARFPLARDLWRCPKLLQVITATLGLDAGLVRGLWFDKPPDQTWSLAWHKDLTIAVERNDLPSTHFAHPTIKAGVSHVEAPVELLQRMLTLRVHLDPMTDDNGPLQVVPGSHHSGKQLAAETHSAGVTILGEPGDVLVMRPLLTHASGNSREGTSQHRRILHLEFAGARELPDGYRWHDFVSV